MKKYLNFLFIVSGLLNAQQKKFLEYHSNINVPFNHANYDLFDKEVNVDSTLHTAFKPYLYKSIQKAFDGEQYANSINSSKKTWLGRIIWNQHLINVVKPTYWLELDVLTDVQAGYDKYFAENTLKNGRILDLKGQIGDKLTFQATTYENQAKFTAYIADYVKINQPEDANGLIPAVGKSKAFGETGFDYAMSTGYINYQPNQFFNLQFGHGKNFIGDGYRSVIFSDVAAPYTYGKITTTIGKLQYTNLWTWLKDFNFSIDANSNLNAGHKRKYGTFHHLSWNVTPKVNVGLFEGIISDNSGTSGAPNVEFFNPIIFYKNIEFNNGEDAGSGVLGLNSKVKVLKKTYAYGQFLLDEFSADKFFTNEGYWANKYAGQLGIKSFDFLSIEGLNLQAEWNAAKPFTYSHEKQHNYAHFGQPLAHLWGANFQEWLMIVRYHYQRWFVNTKVIVGSKGFDFDANSVSYGGNIFINTTHRNADYGQKMLQGNLAKLFHLEAEVAYLVNPVKNMKLYGGVLYRKFNSNAPITRVGIAPENTGSTFNVPQTMWFTIGLKSDLFNNYNDY